MTDELIEALREGLSARADSGRAPGMQRYMKSEMPFLGVPSAGVDAVVRESVRRHPIRDRADLERTVGTLFREATHREEWYAALGLLRRPASLRLLTPDSIGLIEKIARRGAWWDVVDSVAKPLTTLLVGHRVDVEPVLRAWMAGNEMWLRRLTIICQLGLRERTDLALLTDAIEAAQHEREFFLRKAIGWALREYSKTDEPWVRGFVDAHPGLSPLSRREALKWLDRRAARRSTGTV